MYLIKTFRTKTFLSAISLVIVLAMLNMSLGFHVSAVSRAHATAKTNATPISVISEGDKAVISLDFRSPNKLKFRVTKADKLLGNVNLATNEKLTEIEFKTRSGKFLKYTILKNVKADNSSNSDSSCKSVKIAMKIRTVSIDCMDIANSKTLAMQDQVALQIIFKAVNESKGLYAIMKPLKNSP